MKKFLKSIVFAALGLLATGLSSCTSGNSGMNTGNVAINFGGPMPGVGGFGRPGPSRGGYMPPRGYRPMKGVPPRCSVASSGNHRFVCDPRGRRIGFLPPHFQYQGQYGYGYGGGGYGGSYGGSRGGYGHGGGGNYYAARNPYERDSNGRYPTRSNGITQRSHPQARPGHVGVNGDGIVVHNLSDWNGNPIHVEAR